MTGMVVAEVKYGSNEAMFRERCAGVFASPLDAHMIFGVLFAEAKFH